MSPFTKPDLDRLALAGCQIEGCDHTKHLDHSGTIFLHARYHIGGQIEVSYQAGSGYVLVACRECHKTIAKISVRE